MVKDAKRLPPPPDADVMVAQLTEFVARLYYHLARAVTDRFGDEGAKTVREAIRSLGRERGTRIRYRVEKAGLPVDLESEYRFHDLPIGSSAWEAETREEGRRHVTRVTRCPFGNFWRSIGAEELGLIYCEIDYAIWEGYQPRIRFQNTRNILRGDPYCEMIYEWRDDEP